MYWSVALDRVEEWRRRLDALGVAMPDDCARDLDLLESLARADWDRADSLLENGDEGWRWPRTVDLAARQLLAVRGRIAEARRALEQVGDLTAAQALLLLDVVYGPRLRAPASRHAGASMELPGRDPRSVSMFVLRGVREALVGDTVQSRRALQRLTSMRDSATSRRFETAFRPWFALMQAGPAFQRNDWASVIRGLEPLVSLGDEPGAGGHLSGDGYLIKWILSEAYMQTGRNRDAVHTLDGILRRPRTRINDWILQGYVRPAARFMLLNLYSQIEGERGARLARRTFLDVFTHPDPEFRWMVEEATESLAEISPPGVRESNGSQWDS
jgi:hypothetical protein